MTCAGRMFLFALVCCLLRCCYRVLCFVVCRLMFVVVCLLLACLVEDRFVCLAVSVVPCCSVCVCCVLFCVWLLD